MFTRKLTATADMYRLEVRDSVLASGTASIEHLQRQAFEAHLSPVVWPCAGATLDLYMHVLLSTLKSRFIQEKLCLYQTLSGMGTEIFLNGSHDIGGYTDNTGWLCCDLVKGADA